LHYPGLKRCPRHKFQSCVTNLCGNVKDCNWQPWHPVLVKRSERRSDKPCRIV
jgi:hypothetical protein